MAVNRRTMYKSVPRQHQISIARKTLRLSDIGARIMGGMTKEDARLILAEEGWSAGRIAAFEAA